MHILSSRYISVFISMACIVLENHLVKDKSYQQIYTLSSSNGVDRE